MHGVVFLGDRKLELKEFPDPTPGPRDVVLEITASGMCGSDLHNYRAPAQPAGAVTGGIRRQAGVIAGHEPCGIVAAIGTGVTEREARVGQRVMNHHYDGCGNCKHCRAGWTQMCLAGPVVFGSGGHGAHAKYMKVPVATLVPLPDSLSFVTGAAISCGTGTAWGALKRTFSKQGQAECAEFVADQHVDVDKLFTHRWKLEQAEEAYKLFDTQTTGKAVILPS